MIRTKVLVLGAAGLAGLFLLIRDAHAAPPVPVPEPNPNGGGGGGPTPLERVPLATGGFPPGEITATVNTPSGVFIRREPRVQGTQADIVAGRPNNAVARAGNGQKLAVVDTPVRPPTAEAPAGWRAVRTPQGIEGFVSDQLLVLDPVPAPNAAGMMGASFSSFRAIPPATRNYFQQRRHPWWRS